MATQSYRDEYGQTVRLGRQCGGGGEAEVFDVVGRGDLVAKIYAKPTRERELKLGLMIADPPVDPCRTLQPPHISIAWPIARLYTDSGSFAGFTMPKVDGAVSLLHVSNPTRREQTSRDFNWNYLHQTAMNLAKAVSAVHERGYVIGDLNESNALVFPNTLVTLVDTDSFQVQQYPCPVGRPEYTPPELQGKALKTVHREVEHDCFGLGVLIFQLLMNGSHPYRARWVGSGTPITTAAEKITQGLFPYSRKPSPYVKPPGPYPLQMLHPALVELVQRCFDDGHQRPDLRPKPAEWAQALETAQQALVQCRRNPTHYYSKHQKKCPWCAVKGDRAAGPTPEQRPLPPVNGANNSQTSVSTASQPHSSTPAKPSRFPGAASPPTPKRQGITRRIQSLLSQINWTIWFWWFAATLLGGLIGGQVVIAPRVVRFDAMLSPWLLNILGGSLGLSEAALALPIISGIFRGALLGTIIGTAQWLVLRRLQSVSRSSWWIIASVVSWSLGLLAIVGGMGAATGVLVSLPQWFVLRRFVRRAGWWIMANAVLGLALGSTGMAALGALALYLVTTATTLSLLLRQPPPPRNLLVHGPNALSLWFQWLLAGAGGWAAGLLVYAGLLPIVKPGINATVLLQDIPLVGWTNPALAFSVSAIWGALGAVLGAGQWFVLRYRIPLARWWAIASAVGLTAGHVFANAVVLSWGPELSNYLRNNGLSAAANEAAMAALFGALIGLGLGTAQWLILPRQDWRVACWILMNVLGWGAAWYVSSSLYAMPLLIGVTSSAATGIVLNFFTAGVLPLNPMTRNVIRWAAITSAVGTVLWVLQF